MCRPGRSLPALLFTPPLQTRKALFTIKQRSILSFSALLLASSLATSLRAGGVRMWDVKVLRQFPIRESLYATFSLDLLNATNHTNFNAPNTDPSSTNFGAITGQNGSSRIMQFNLRVDS